MKNAFIMLALAATFASCNIGGNSDPNSDDKDSIDAARAADSLLQNELNADTSAKTDTSVTGTTQPGE